MEDDCFPLDMSAGMESLNLFFLPEFFSSLLAGLFLWGHLESMSQVMAEDCSNAFASVLTVFSTASS